MVTKLVLAFAALAVALVASACSSSANAAGSKYSAAQVTAAFDEAGISLSSFSGFGFPEFVDFSRSTGQNPWLDVDVYPSATYPTIASAATMRVQKLNYKGYALTRTRNVLIWVLRSAPHSYAQRVRTAIRDLTRRS